MDFHHPYSTVTIFNFRLGPDSNMTNGSLIDEVREATYLVTFKNVIIDIARISLLLLIIFLSSTYVILFFTDKNLRSTKLTWPTINVCLATILFALIQLVHHILLLEDTRPLLSCRLHSFFVDASGCFMMYSHSISALNRLLSARYFYKLKFRSRLWLLSTIGFGWFVGLLVALPYLFFDGFTCTMNQREELLRIYTLITTFLLPVTLVTLCDLSIYFYIRQARQRVHNQDLNRTNQNIFNKRDIQLSKWMFLTFCIFVFGWSPIFLEELFFEENRRLPVGISALFQLILPISLVLDVFLLMHSNQSIRRRIQRLFKCNHQCPWTIQG